MKVTNTDENSRKCICRDCPSYIEDQDEGFFCSIGKSSEQYEKKGCICGKCALWDEYKLSSGYYCVIGEAV